jgi:sterol desaturase/sphingolipid hydroxylase (fatty acid hydroxylase superfamily)
LASLLFLSSASRSGSTPVQVLFRIRLRAHLFVHYSIHVYAPPKLPQVLVVAPPRHAPHYRREVAFGVSTTLWDHIVGMPTGGK